jgi:FkbM family methyltransferase
MNINDYPLDLNRTVTQLRGAEYLRQASLRNTLLAKRDSRQYATPKEQGPLRIVYPVNRVDPCGGARVVLEHANRLSARGHQVTVVGHMPRPVWMRLEAEYRQVPFHSDLWHGIGPCDVIVATYWDQIPGCVACGQAKVLYFEQGDFHLYSQIAPDQLQNVRSCLKLADAVIAVSDSAAEALTERFGTNVVGVIRNGIDSELFRPGTQAATERSYLLVVGSEKNAFKRLDDAFAAWELLVRNGVNLDLVWVTPSPPSHPHGQVVVAPAQERLVQLYQGAFAFISASEYESFSLPPLESMACGTPVVVAHNDGVRRYAQHEHNALVVPTRDPAAIADAVQRLRKDSSLYEKLRTTGIETATQFDWKQSIDSLETLVVTHNGRRVDPIDASWKIQVSPDDLGDTDTYQRLIGYLRESTASIVKIPAVGEAFARHFVATWLTAAERSEGDGVQNLWAPFMQTETTWPEGVELFRSQRLQQALTWFFARHAQAASTIEKATWLRWLVLCAIEAGEDTQAKNWVSDALRIYPEHTDFWYLAAVLETLQKRPEIARNIASAAQILGDATTYPEFFYSMSQLCEPQLETTPESDLTNMPNSAPIEASGSSARVPKDTNGTTYLISNPVNVDFKTQTGPHGVYVGGGRVLTSPLWGGRLFVLGSDLSVSPSIILHGIYELALTRFLVGRLKAGCVFLDGGANLGYFTILASLLVGRTGRVIAVEAIPELAELVRDNVHTNYVEPWVSVIQGAIGMGEGTVTIEQVGKFMGEGSLEPIERDFRGEHKKIEVPIVHLDDVLNDVERIDVIKLDIEGAEFAAVKCLERTIEKGKLGDIVFEWNKLALRDDAQNLVTWLRQQVDRGATFGVVRDDGSAARAQPEELMAIDWVPTLLLRLQAPK